MAIQSRMIELAAEQGQAGTQANYLTAQGVIGLRMSDLQQDNIACCGDCQFFALHASRLGGVEAACQKGHATSLYSTRASSCPEFTLHAPLSDTVQEDERCGDDRRAVQLSVLVERRSGRDRRSHTVCRVSPWAVPAPGHSVNRAS